MKFFKNNLLKLLSFLTVIGGFGLTNAYAESGYRVCAVYHQVDGKEFPADGLATKVAKENSGDTCGKKLSFMTNYFGNAYPRVKPTNNFKMVTCEDFSKHIGTDFNEDICRSMEVNKIYQYHYYRYTSNKGKTYYSRMPTIKFWHN